MSFNDKINAVNFINCLFNLKTNQNKGIITLENNILFSKEGKRDLRYRIVEVSKCNIK